MSKLNRRKIRKLIRDRLVEANTRAKGNVFINREQNLNTYELPLIVVSSPSEVTTVHATAPLMLRRELDVVIAAVMQAEDRLDEHLDYLAEEIEAAVNKDNTFNQNVLAILDSSELDIDEEGETSLGSVSLTYKVVYHTVETPERPTFDYEGNNIDFKEAA